MDYKLVTHAVIAEISIKMKSKLKVLEENEKSDFDPGGLFPFVEEYFSI